MPVCTASGVFNMRESILVSLKNAHGETCSGEIAPWQGFVCETLDEAERALKNPSNVDFSRLPCTRHALAAAKFFLENPAAKTAPEPAHSATLISRVPEMSPQAIAEKIMPENRAGTPAVFKIKIGMRPLREEIKFCRDVLKIAQAQGNCRLRFDANGAWNGKDALDALAELNAFPNLEFIEQPLAATPENDALIFALPPARAEKIALDESLREVWNVPADARIVAVVKPLLIGDFQKLRAWLAQTSGTRYVISSVFESEIGRAVLRFLCEENKKNPRQLSAGTQTQSFF